MNLGASVQLCGNRASSGAASTPTQAHKSAIVRIAESSATVGPIRGAVDTQIRRQVQKLRLNLKRKKMTKLHLSTKMTTTAHAWSVFMRLSPGALCCAAWLRVLLHHAQVRSATTRLSSPPLQLAHSSERFFWSRIPRPPVTLNFATPTDPFALPRHLLLPTWNSAVNLQPYELFPHIGIDQPASLRHFQPMAATLCSSSTSSGSINVRHISSSNHELTMFSGRRLRLPQL